MAIPRFQIFGYDGFSFDEAAKTVKLHYSLDDRQFTETFRFDFPFAKNYSKPALDQALFALMVAAGVSYYKAALPPRVTFTEDGLTAAQAKFFGTVYEHGLGEFFYQNKLKPRRPGFPSGPASAPQAIQLPKLSGAILPIGGGKDSTVAADILKQQRQPFATWTVNQSKRLAGQLGRIGRPHLAVERRISPELLKLNRQGAWNGHVPISTILAFLSVCTAILTDRRDLVWANEHSASEPNLVYQGLEVNHQYSKSLEFERDFQTYVRKFISPDLRYFSLLRPLTEIAVADLFSQRLFKRFKGVFSSCNRNFHLHGDRPGLRWCGECPKCAFVFTILAPFVPREELLELFGGQNLFASKKLRPTFTAMLGRRDHKPFECVGETAEVRAAMQLAEQTGEWPELSAFRFPKVRYDYKRLRSAAMPAEYQKLLKNYLRAHPFTAR